MYPFYQFCIGKICKLVSSERVKQDDLKIQHFSLKQPEMTKYLKIQRFSLKQPEMTTKLDKTAKKHIWINLHLYYPFHYWGTRCWSLYKHCIVLRHMANYNNTKPADLNRNDTRLLVTTWPMCRDSTGGHDLLRERY